MRAWSQPGKAVGKWPIEMLPYNPDAYVITNIGRFAHCRQDSFCRCRKCKPPLRREA